MWSLLLSIPSKVWAYVGAALAAIVLYLKVVGNAENAGRLKAEQEQREANDRIKDAWDKIDDKDLSVDDAIKRLRERSRKS